MKKHQELQPPKELVVIFKDGEYHCVCYTSDDTESLIKLYNYEDAYEAHHYVLKESIK